MRLKVLVSAMFDPHKCQDVSLATVPWVNLCRPPRNLVALMDGAVGVAAVLFGSRVLPWGVVWVATWLHWDPLGDEEVDLWKNSWFLVTSMSSVKGSGRSWLKYFAWCGV